MKYFNPVCSQNYFKFFIFEDLFCLEIVLEYSPIILFVLYLNLEYSSMNCVVLK